MNSKLPKVMVLRGLPWSGKSSRAKQYLKENPKTVRLNKDLARDQYFDGKHTKEREKFVIAQRNSALSNAILAGYNVIVDDTNFHDSHIKAITAIASWISPNIDIEVVDFHAWPELCKRRNKLRFKSVPDHAIERMYEQNKDTFNFIEGEDYMYVPDKSLPPAAIFDIDGTIARMEWRSPYDYSKVSEDSLIEQTKHILNWLRLEGYKIILLTGREWTYQCTADTEERLEKHNINYDLLLFREESDTRKDSIIKRELFDTISYKYNIEMVVDDRLQMAEMRRSIGLRCYQCDRGNF